MYAFEFLFRLQYHIWHKGILVVFRGEQSCGGGGNKTESDTDALTHTGGKIRENLISGFETNGSPKQIELNLNIYYTWDIFMIACFLIWNDLKRNAEMMVSLLSFRIIRYTSVRFVKRFFISCSSHVMAFR